MVAVFSMSVVSLRPVLSREDAYNTYPTMSNPLPELTMPKSTDAHMKPSLSYHI